MIVVVALLGLLLSPQQSDLCADLASCRARAEAARDAKDFEAFHDLAWAAYRQGTNNDPALMLLVARAQSLSGRPGDALVMLERIAALGAATDAATSEDFARVRALPRWSEVAERLAPPSSATDSPVVKAAEKPPAKAPAPSAKAATPTAKDPAPSAKESAPSAKAPAPRPKESASSAKESAPSAKEPLSFTTVLTPGALAYDAVSKRFIIADGRARRVAVIDETTGGVATLAGGQGALGEIRGMSIDPQQGDLWVVSTSDEGPVLHRMQLISGRMLASVPLAVADEIVAIAFVRGTGLVAADAGGRIWRVRPDGKAGKLASLEYVPLGVGADARGRLYVAGGASRIARFSVGATLRKIDTVEIAEGIPPDAPFAVSGDRIHYIVPMQGNFEIRSFRVR